MGKDYNGITSAAVMGDKKTRVITIVKVQRNENAGPPKLLIYKGRRFRALVFSAIMLAVFGMILFGYFNRDPLPSWTIPLAPILFFGLVGLLMPVSEEWEYTPWQSQTQQVEQITYD